MKYILVKELNGEHNDGFTEDDTVAQPMTLEAGAQGVF